VVTERTLFPVNAGMRARIVALIGSLRALGFSVVLIGRRPAAMAATWRTWWLADRFIAVDTAPFRGGSPSGYDAGAFVNSVRRAIARYSPVAMIAEYLWMAPCLDAAPGGIRRFVDTHDLMHVRKDEPRLTDPWVVCSADEERELLRRADTVIAIQPDEREALRALVGDRDVICIPHHLPVRPARTRRNRPVVAVVGSGNPANVDGLTHFLDHAWPLVLAARPDAQLRIYGELAQSAPEARQVVRVGYVRDLRSAYRDATVIINPVRAGTGLKIKSVEAIAHGKALVTTSCGADGLTAGAGRAYRVADDPAQFSDAVVALLTDRTSRAAIESAALTFAAREFACERVYAEFLQAVS
jgi:glycosyltransferase involved in cell wall biosynthesis